MAETHSEKRSAADHLDLISIDEELKKQMAESYQAATVDTSEYEVGEDRGPDNFRAYDQNQDFFVSVYKKTFLDSGHPAAVIDSVIEKLDLEAVRAIREISLNAGLNLVL